jgi:hypothetical protein
VSGTGRHRGASRPEATTAFGLDGKRVLSARAGRRAGRQNRHSNGSYAQVAAFRYQMAAVMFSAISDQNSLPIEHQQSPRKEKRRQLSERSGHLNGRFVKTASVRSWPTVMIALPSRDPTARPTRSRPPTRMGPEAAVGLKVPSALSFNPDGQCIDYTVAASGRSTVEIDTSL